MSRLFKKGIIFLCLTVFIYVILFSLLYFIKPTENSLLYYTSETLRSKGKRHSYKSFNEFNTGIKNGPYDIVVLGSSQAYRGYDPRIFAAHNIRMHNLGTSSQIIQNTEVISKHMINQESAKAVILDIFLGGITGEGIESTINLVQNIPSRKASTEMIWRMKDIRGLNMFMLRLFDDYFLVEKEIDKSVSYYHKNSTYISGGFSQTPDSFMVEKDDERIYKVGHPHLKYVDAILADLEKKEIPVYLVMAPQPRLFLPKNKTAFLKDIQQIAAKYKNTKVLDFAWALPLEAKYHYFDRRHLNQAGVEIFNNELIQYLK